MAETDPIAKLRELYEKATPGEWIVEEYEDDHLRIVSLPNRFHPARTHGNSLGDEYDANFIAGAHNAMPAIIALREECERLRVAVEAHRQQNDELRAQVISGLARATQAEADRAELLRLLHRYMERPYLDQGPLYIHCTLCGARWEPGSPERHKDHCDIAAFRNAAERMRSKT